MNIKKNSQLLGLLMPIFIISITANLPSVNASSEEEISCSDRGYIDGQDHPFNQGTYDRCGDDYYQGFIQGCMSVEGNSRDICESATDA